MDYNLGNLDDLYDLDSRGASAASAFGQRVFDEDGFFDDVADQKEKRLGLDMRTARKIEVERIAQANRDAASPQEREIANMLRDTQIQNLHPTHKDSANKSSCIFCARGIASFYEQNGSNIYFAMIDSRWPRFICKHLKVSYRCSECDGVSLCLHGRERFRCPVCGNGMCHNPEHEKYRKFKPLRKNNCPGCKKVKSEAIGASQGGSTKKEADSSKGHDAFACKGNCKAEVDFPSQVFTAGP